MLADCGERSAEPSGRSTITHPPPSGPSRARPPWASAMSCTMEPEPGAPARAAAPEPLEGSLGKVIAEAWSGIANHELNATATAASGQLDLARAVQ